MIEINAKYADNYAIIYIIPMALYTLNNCVHRQLLC